MPTHPTPCAGLGNFPFRQIFWLFVAGKSKEICASCLHIVCPVNESTGGQAVQVEVRGNYILIWYYGVFPFLKDISLLTSCSLKLYETHCKYALTQSVLYTGYFLAQQTSLAASESSLLSLVFSKIVILFYFIYLFSFFATLSLLLCCVYVKGVCERGVCVCWCDVLCILCKQFDNLCRINPAPFS